MKRIVDGLTYNTETSTLLAKAEWTHGPYSPHEGAECEGELYQTRGGAFFLVTTIHTQDAEGEPKDKVECEPMTTEQAQKWLLEGEVEVYHNPFEDPPEAEAESEGGATIYIRVPAALKRDVDEAAGEAKVSMNVWAMRCVEHCLRFPEELTAIFSIARNLTSAWKGDKPDAKVDPYKLTKAVEALEEIASLVEDFAMRRFGTDDLVNISGYDSFQDGPEIADINRRYRPYPQD